MVVVDVVVVVDDVVVVGAEVVVPGVVVGVASPTTDAPMVVVGVAAGTGAGVPARLAGAGVVATVEVLGTATPLWLDGAPEPGPGPALGVLGVVLGGWVAATRPF